MTQEEMRQDTGISLKTILEEALEKQQKARFECALRESNSERYSYSLIGYADNRFYGAGTVYFPPEQYTVWDMRKFAHINTVVQKHIAELISGNNKLTAVILVRHMAISSLIEAHRYVMYVHGKHSTNYLPLVYGDI